MCDGQKRQKRHKRRRIGFPLFLLTLTNKRQASTSPQESLRCEKYFGKRSAASQGSVAPPWTRVRSRGGDDFPSAATFSLAGRILSRRLRGKKKVKNKNRHAEADDARPATRQSICSNRREQEEETRPGLVIEAAAPPPGSGGATASSLRTRLEVDTYFKSDRMFSCVSLMSL